MVVNFTSQFIKYLVYGLIVNLLFSYIPQKQLPKSDIILMISVIILSFIFLDFLSPYENFSAKNNNNIIENLDITTDQIENEDTENEDNNDVEFIISNKPEILKNLQNKKILDEEEINEILEICKDKQECNNKFLSLLNNNKINNDELLELYVAFGLNNYNIVQELYLQERINKEQSLEIAYSISSNSRTLIKAVIDKYLQNNEISKNDYDKLLKNINLVEDNNEGRSYVANMIKNNLLNSKDAKIINEKCSSSSMDSCVIQINKYKKDKLINDSQSISILKGYNKPGTNDLINDNTQFGSISNEYDIGSINEQTDLGEVRFSNNLLSDDELLKQSKSVNEKSFDNIDKKEDESNEDFVKKFNKSIETKNNKYKESKTSSLYDIHSDMNYSIYSEKQSEPLGKFSSDFTNKFEHGFDYLKTNKWKPPQYESNICKIDDKCSYCDDDYDGYPVDVSKWNYSRKILPRDNINIKYIEDKLNKGNI